MTARIGSLHTKPPPIQHLCPAWKAPEVQRGFANGYYQASSSELAVRVDVVYLRQDFSAMQRIADAEPWPEMQRFDYLVRTRVLTEDEAASYRDKLMPHQTGVFSPYHRAALAALRELTGRDTEPSAHAWRRLLNLPEWTALSDPRLVRP
jgi:hypothetical protein